MRAALLASTAVAAAAAWTVAASAGTLWAADLWSHPYFAHGPSWAWSWWHYMGRPDTRAALGPSLLTGAAAASLPFGLAVRHGMARLRGASSLHGKTGWLSDREAKAGGFSFSRLPRPDSIVIGTRGRGPLRRYVGLPGEEHAALTAKTRSGKGVSVVVPNALNWSGSLVCFSVKRDVFEAAAGHRTRMGDAVFVFDLSDPQRRTHRWNPLGYVRRGEVETYGDIYRAMWFLVPETKANNPYFNDAARKMAAAVAVILAETPGARLNVAEVLNAVQRPAPTPCP
jgi:type IV secretion system protein VirD4